MGAAVIEKALVKPAGVGALLEAELGLGAGNLGEVTVATPLELLRFDSVSPSGDSLWTDPDNAITGGTGTYAQPFGDALLSSNGFLAGQLLFFQWWSRDNGYAPPDNFGLSDALRVMVCP